MARPHYVATRVGDQFLLVPADGGTKPSGRPELLVGGVALAAAAVFWRGPARWSLIGLAGALVAVWFGLNRRSGDPSRAGDRRASPITHGPSFPRDQTAAATRSSRANQRPADDVDEASMESFPASDPPAHMSSTQAV